MPREVIEGGGARYLAGQRGGVEVDEVFRRLYEIADAQPFLEELGGVDCRIVGCEPLRPPPRPSVDQRLARKDEPRLFGRYGTVVDDAVGAQGEPQEGDALPRDHLLAALVPVGLEEFALDRCRAAASIHVGSTSATRRAYTRLVSTM